MQQSEILESLKSFPIATALNESELAFLAESGQLRLVGKSEYVYKQGEPSNEIFFLLNGVIKITSNINDSKEVIRMVVHPKALLSEQSFAGEKIRSSNAISMTQDVEN